MFRATTTLLLLTAAATPAAAQRETLTMEAAVATALAHNRGIDSADLDVEKASQELKSVRTRRLPQFGIDTQVSQLLRPIDVHFPQGAFGEYPGIGPVPAADSTVRTPAQLAVMFSAQVTQPLTQLRGIGLDVKFSDAERTLQLEAARAARQTLVYEVKRVYFAIVQGESAIAAADHSLAMLRELRRVVGDRVIQRTALDGDALDVDVRLARAALERTTLVNAAAGQKEQLNRLLGRDIRTPFDTAGVPGGDPMLDDAEAATTVALASRPDVRQSRLRLQQAEIARQRAQADFIPDVSLSLSYLSPINIDGAPRHIASAGVQLQWEPFDFGRRSRTVAAKALAVRQAANAVRDQEDQALIEVSTRARKLVEARAELNVAALEQRAARETSRVRATQYRAQAVLLTEVLHSAAAQADADYRYQRALAALWVAQADYELALGED